VVELETQIRSLKLERVRFLQDMDSLLARSKRFLQEEAPEMFPPPDVTRKLDEREAARLDPIGPATVPGGPRPSQITLRKIKD
jgi:cell division initiation protein